MDERWKTNPGCVYNVSYHIIWCTKYRRKLLLGEVEERLRSLLIEKATPSDSIAHITSQLKGYTSFSLRNEFPHLKQRVPTLWTRSYYVETIGHISEKTILKYIEDQKKK